MDQSKNKCDQCGKQFSQRSSRNRHIREQHLQPGSFECKQCGIRFSKKYNLQMHIKHAHSKDITKDKNLFKCSYCTCIFTKISVLKKHTKDYHEKNLRKLSTNNENVNVTDSNDPQVIANNVLLELQQLQKDMVVKQHNQTEDLLGTSNCTQEKYAVDAAIVQEITVKDKLYPLGHFTQHKVQKIKRLDGFSYYICEFCSKEFKKTYNYLRHRRAHTKIRPFKCVLCKKSFPTTAQLKTHCFTHQLHEQFGIFKRLYKCPKCEDGFTSIQRLEQHLSTHLETTISYNCPECLKSFKSLKSLLYHKHYKKDKELELLKTLLPVSLSLVEEENSKTTVLKETPGVYICSLCGLKLSSKIILKQHEKRHQNLFKYQCNRCNGSFVSQSSLNVHKKRHLNQKTLKCPNCSKTYQNNYQLRRHQLTHSKNKNYKCQYCVKTFKTPQNCRRHMITHLKQLINTREDNKDQNETLTSYATVVRDLNNQQILNTSMQIVRSAKKNQTKNELDNKKEDLKFKCLKCNKYFRYAAWLRKHFKYKHTNEKPYECNICFKKYRTKQILQNHMLVHNETKLKVSCRVCGKQYASDKSLRVHLRIHTVENPFKCDKCNKQFRTSGHLIQHRKSNHKDI